MASQSILKARAVLFLGAGATAPLGKKLMREFIKHLEGVGHIATYALFHDIIAKNADLEFLLEELQDLETKSYLKYDMVSRGLPPPPPPQPQRNERNFPEIARKAQFLRQAVEQQVFLHYRSFDDPEKVKEHFQPLFQSFFNDLPPKHPIVVFTTNYDRGVEEFCRQVSEVSLFDGFVSDQSTGDRFWSRKSIDEFRPEKKKRSVVLFKLHGSTNWFRSGNRIVKGPDVFTAGDPMHPNILIYPATRKVATDDPFFTAYDCLQKCLSHVRCLLAVGYSFRDEDALTRLRSAVRANPKLKIAVVAPDAKKLTERLANSDISAEPIGGFYQGFEIVAPSVSPFVSPRGTVLGRIREFLRKALASPATN